MKHVAIFRQFGTLKARHGRPPQYVRLNMSKLPEIFDHYSLRARLQPALITLFPLALGFIAWTGVDNFRSSALWSLCGTVGLTFLLSVVVRHRGKTIEPSLWESWGGSPTTLLLRHKGPANSVMRERWHKYLSKSVGKAFPSAVDEEKNPSAADEIYKASVRILISKTRDVKKFRLLFKENIAYGFCRNLYAMRLIGIDIAALGMLASISAAIWFR